MVDELPLTEALAGAASAVAALALTGIQPRELQRPLAGTVVVVVATGWGLELVPGRLLVAVSLGFVAGFSASRELRGLGGFIAVAALATVLPLAIGSTERLVVAGTIFVVAFAVAHLTANASPVVLVVLIATAAGGFLAAPDTERIALVAGALVVVSVWSAVFRRVPGEALVVLTALVTWAGTTDARGRPAALVATIAPVAMLLVVALMARRRRVVPLVALISVMAGLAVFVGRVAGLRSGTTIAWLLGAAAFVVGSVLAWLLSRSADEVNTASGGRTSQA